MIIACFSGCRPKAGRFVYDVAVRAVMWAITERKKKMDLWLSGYTIVRWLISDSPYLRSRMLPTSRPLGIQENLLWSSWGKKSTNTLGVWDLGAVICSLSSLFIVLNLWRKSWQHQVFVAKVKIRCWAQITPVAKCGCSKFLHCFNSPPPSSCVLLQLLRSWLFDRPTAYCKGLNKAPCNPLSMESCT